MELCCSDPGLSLAASTVRKKKTRRGRKRRCRCQSSFDDQPACACGRRNAHAKADTRKMQRMTGPASRRQFLRPNSPKAPMNTTDFLMEDHLSIRQPSFANIDLKIDQCKKWSPSHVLEEDNQADNIVFSPEEQCVPGTFSVGRPAAHNRLSPAFSDIDYEYESIECGDTLSFLQQDFETAYTNVLEESLSLLTKEDLITKIVTMQEKLTKIEPVKTHTETVSLNFEDLLSELKVLQEENQCLKDENNILRTMLPS